MQSLNTPPDASSQIPISHKQPKQHESCQVIHSPTATSLGTRRTVGKPGIGNGLEGLRTATEDGFPADLDPVTRLSDLEGRSDPTGSGP